MAPMTLWQEYFAQMPKLAARMKQEALRFPNQLSSMHLQQQYYVSKRRWKDHIEENKSHPSIAVTFHQSRETTRIRCTQYFQSRQHLVANESSLSRLISPFGRLDFL
jgi:hypothetical protein